MQHTKQLLLIGAFLSAIAIGPNPALLGDDDIHDPSVATSQFDVHPELEVGPFAALWDSPIRGVRQSFRLRKAL